MKKIIVLICCVLFAVSAFAKGNDNKNKNKKKNLPPGLEKKVDRGGELPPGWQKKVAKGEVLDDDIYEASIKLPSSKKDKDFPELDNDVEVTPGTELIRIEEKVLRIKKDTKEILDIFGVKTD